VAFVLHCCFINIYEYKVPMPKVTYIEHNGTQHEVSVESGLSIMEGAVQNGVPGIDADCGGACACATCHVYVKEEWLDKLSEQSDSEKDMLDFAFETKSNSRLSCQLILEDKHDGIVVNLPEKQG
jgi:2Fe-2S ferredoxin